jgi:hypothetical protein
MRYFSLAVLATGLFATPALAADDALATAYGNTFVIVDPDGVESRMVYSADHTMKGRVPSADYNYKGTWALDGGGKICRTYSPAIPGVPNPDCDAEAAVPRKIGDQWSSTNRGKAYKISLVAGGL